MPNDSSPVSFRISNEERALLEAVAHYMGETLSNFIRRSAVTLAQSIVDNDSPDVVLKGYREMLARKASWDSDQLAGLERQLQRSVNRGAAAVAARQKDRQD
ncbi:type II toxin -antitoxin system TacA 1-like antitoxin [Actinokineospora sp.]|uniref:type II toxin -antitoxin system TacA 1-like antitoxin n=1 Tax=Actinokineospora sp. TaxID=1872133 RepID=UPI004037DE82